MVLQKVQNKNIVMSKINDELIIVHADVYEYFKCLHRKNHNINAKITIKFKGI